MSNTSYDQDDREYPDASAAEYNVPRLRGVQEHGGNRPEPPLPTPNASIVSMRERLARIINQQLKRMEKGEIIQLSDQHNSMLQQLASLSVSGSSSAALPESNLDYESYNLIQFN